MITITVPTLLKSVKIGDTVEARIEGNDRFDDRPVRVTLTECAIVVEGDKAYRIMGVSYHCADENTFVISAPGPTEH